MENPAFDVAALLAPPDILKSKCALCIQPHPDDNEIGMGGTVAVLAQAGCTVHYLTVTNGDQGNKNRTASPQETARVRRAEAIAAGTHLGAKEFHFLDHGDGTLDDVLGLSAQIARVIREVRPDAIFAPDPWLAYESHLDHAVTGRAAANAFLMSGRAAIPGSRTPRLPSAIILPRSPIPLWIFPPYSKKSSRPSRCMTARWMRRRWPCIASTSA